MKKILIVEDEYETIEDIGKRLQEGYEVDIARNATEAKRDIEKTIYDVVLLDIMLPPGDDIPGPPERAGVEVLKIIRERSKETKVIILTAIMNNKTYSDIKKYHPEELVSKPVDGNELYNLITGLV